MKPNEIRAALKLNGIRIVDIAQWAQVSGPTVHRAITRAARCRRAEEQIARVLGLSREKLFGLNKREKQEGTHT